MKKEIPIFFSTDDAYIPYLDVAIASLIDNASKNYQYRIIVLNTGIRQENIDMIKSHEKTGVVIDFADISEDLKYVESHFKNVYHFSIATYYRMFIASLFPQYDKIVYLDCDLVVLGDISQLYHIELGDNIIGAIPDQYVRNTAEFRRYAEIAVGVNPDHYVNAGVLVINLDAFRKNKIEDQFIQLLTQFDFDLLDPDQAYLNYLCRNKIHMLPNGWNKVPTPIACEGNKNIVHYALYKKPWQYDDVIDGEFFWQYAKESPFYQQILQNRASFGHAEQMSKEADACLILEHAKTITASDHTFAKQFRR